MSINHQKPLAKNLYVFRDLIMILLASYFLCGLTLGLRGFFFKEPGRVSNQEIFPVFSWFLFSKTPNTVQRFTVLVSEYDGNKFDPPVYWREAARSVKPVSGADIHAVRVLCKRMNEVYMSNDQEKFNELRIEFENIYLSDSVVKYQIVEESYNPLERWKFGDDKMARKNIGYYQVGN